MADVQGTSTDNSIADLHDRLDALWTRYLDLLDEYTAAQASIKQHLSSGFLSLAKANFHSSGRRYGQDSYDQRAVATTRVAFKTEGERLKIEVVKLESDQAKESTKPSKGNPTSEPSDSTNESKKPSPTHLLSPSPTPTPTPSPDSKTNPPLILDENPANDANAEEEEEEAPPPPPPPPPKPDSQDPTRQFGILIPPSLRSAQTSFAKAVLSPETLTRAVRAAREMRGVEVEMRRVRKGVRKAEREKGEGVRVRAGGEA